MDLNGVILKNNMKLNNRENIIYLWLKDRKGYLKKGVEWIYENQPENNTNRTAIWEECFNALKQARIDSKQSNTIKPIKSLKSKEKGIERGYIETYHKPTPKNVLVIADTHFPFCKEGYLEHCLTISKKYNCNEFIHIGDEVDLCGVSQWEKDPDGFSAGTEASLAQEDMKTWYKHFPNMKVCIGNHTARPFRQAKSNGVPKKFIKSYEEAWEAPRGWQWADSWEIDGVHYTHGTGFSGANAAITIATRHRQNTVIGHIHSQAGIQYSASKIDLVWGMQVGGALDDSSYAAYYAKDQLKKSIIGCGVVLEGKLPIFEPMLL